HLNVIGRVSFAVGFRVGPLAGTAHSRRSARGSATHGPTGSPVGTQGLSRFGKQHGQARIRHEPVSGRLRRPHGIRSQPHALPPLHRGGSETGGEYIRAPNV